MTWEWTIARPMLCLHALAGFASLAILVHVAYFALRGGGERGAGRRARAQKYAAIAWPVYVAAMVTGALVYPAYMVGVRAPWLEANRPALVGFFEIKEHWGAIGLLLAWAMWWYICRGGTAVVAAADRSFWRGQAILILLATVCAAYNVIVGLWIVMVRSV